MEIKNLDNITFNLEKSVTFNGEIELLYFRIELRKGKRIKEGRDWKQIPENGNFNISKILGFRELPNYQKKFLENDISVQYQDKIDSCCSMYYLTENHKITEYIVLYSFKEMRKIQKQIEEIKQIVNRIISSHEINIKEEIKETIKKIHS